MEAKQYPGWLLFGEKTWFISLPENHLPFQKRHFHLAPVLSSVEMGIIIRLFESCALIKAPPMEGGTGITNLPKCFFCTSLHSRVCQSSSTASLTFHSPFRGQPGEGIFWKFKKACAENHPKLKIFPTPSLTDGKTCQEKKC